MRELLEQWEAAKVREATLRAEKERLKVESIAADPDLETMSSARYPPEFRKANDAWYASTKDLSSVEDRIMGELARSVYRLPNGNILVPIDVEGYRLLEEYEEYKE